MMVLNPNICSRPDNFTVYGLQLPLFGVALLFSIQMSQILFLDIEKCS